jgi:ATP-dependent phosphoenolpyruvate carboxykinase
LITNLFRVAELYEYALLPEHLTSVDPSIYPTTVTDTGALSVSSGSKTGRSPKEKRVVLDETTKDVRFIRFADSLTSHGIPIESMVGQR